MATHDYIFQSRWNVEGTVAEVTAILRQPLELPRWWPAVYLSARAENDVTHLHTRGLLPYTLRWSFRTQDLRVEAWGDLEGQGESPFSPPITAGPWPGGKRVCAWS